LCVSYIGSEHINHRSSREWRRLIVLVDLGATNAFGLGDDRRWLRLFIVSRIQGNEIIQRGVLRTFNRRLIEASGVANFMCWVILSTLS
jgi:hypothetical protein